PYACVVRSLRRAARTQHDCQARARRTTLAWYPAPDRLSVNGPISNRRRGSLAYRLPLLIIALLAILVAGGAALAYTEVRTTAMQAWSERLTRISSQLASVVEAGAAERLGQVRQIANAPSIVDFLSGRGT